MDHPVIERDVVLIGKTEEGNDTFDFPVTRLENIESDAEIKESPEAGDHFPVIDNSDGGKMKKTSMNGILMPLNTHIGDNIRHITAAERNTWNGKADGDHDHDGRYYTKTETNTRLSEKADKNHTHALAAPSAPGFMSAADKTKIDGIKVSGINATYGKVPYYGNQTADISHKVDLVFVWVDTHGGSEPNLVIVSPLCPSNSILGGEISMTDCDDSASISFSFRQAFGGYCYYAALQLS